MRFYIGLIISLLYANAICAQCPPDGNYILKTQQQVDDFLGSYPDCTELLNHNIEIIVAREDFGAPVENLLALSQLKRINGYLNIYNSDPTEYTNPSLLSLDGLENITKLQSLGLFQLPLLTSLEPITNIDSLLDFSLQRLPGIVNIDFENLHVSEDLRLDCNENLESITGINITEGLDRLILRKNFKFVTTDFLNGLGVINRQLILEHNDISFVGALAAVDNLALYGTSTVTDLSAFTNLSWMTGSLNLYNLQIEDLSFFEQIASNWINSLYIENCTIQSLDGLNLTDFQGQPLRQINLTLTDNPNLVDMSYLSNRPHFTGINLESNPLIDDLSDFTNVDSIDNMSIRFMSGLQNMKGLDNIKRIGVLGIGFNPNIKNLDGLETLESLTNALTIYNNDILKDVDALENLIEFKTDNNFKAIHFQHNPELESILGLRNIFGQLSAFTIENNPKLETCSLPIICTAIENNANGLVVDNKVGCENRDQILAQCLDPVTIKIFLDRNENSLDDIEPGVTIGQVLYNDIYSLLPNNEGIVKFSPIEGDISAEYLAPEYWATTTQDAFDFSTVTNSGDSLRVGITPTVLIDSIDSYIIHGPPICDLPYYLFLIVKNNGTTTVNVTQKIIGLGTFSYASETPIFSDESTATFEINNLFPGQTRIIKTIFVSPNIIDLPLGALTFQTLATTAVNETGTQFLQDTTVYQHEFLCAYDPNDKRVTPAGVQDEHYTLFAEKELQYNIRFQNTGNYMARTVIIRDTLDQNLDLSTFNYVGASHPITQVKVERNYLEFVFENINLPDSLHNEAESHGFVSYTISPKDNLAEFTKIENTAHIYFDSNPAIVTNTTFNTMVSIIPGLDAIDENTDNPALHLFPNPVHDLLHINRVNELYGSTYTISDTQGQRITSGQLNKSGSINVSDFPSGIYFIKAENYLGKFIVR